MGAAAASPEWLYAKYRAAPGRGTGHRFRALTRAWLREPGQHNQRRTSGAETRHPNRVSAYYALGEAWVRDGPFGSTLRGGDVRDNRRRSSAVHHCETRFPSTFTVQNRHDRGIRSESESETNGSPLGRGQVQLMCLYDPSGCNGHA